MLVCAAQTLDRTPINQSKSREDLIAGRGQVDNLIFSYSLLHASTHKYLHKLQLGPRRSIYGSLSGRVSERMGREQARLHQGQKTQPEWPHAGHARPTGVHRGPASNWRWSGLRYIVRILCVKQATTWITVLIMYKWSCPDRIRIVASKHSHVVFRHLPKNYKYVTGTTNAWWTHNISTR